jgi:trigger factor
VSGALATNVSELPDSRVRVQVEVEPGAVEESIDREARQLARKLKVPGFRRGKVPPALALQRVGREAVLEEAVRSSLGGWYASAIESAGIVPVGDPKVELGELPAQDEAFQFSIEVGVLPKARVGMYKGLEVGRREPAASDEAIDEEIEALRERLARLEDVERPVESGDFVVIDYVGSMEGKPIDGGEGRDQLIEVGAGRLIGGLEQGLIGANRGEERSLAVTFPADYAEQRLAGRPATFDVTVKQVKRKDLPQVDEDLAADAGFDSLEALRAEIAGRLEEVDRDRAEREFREAALDEAVANAEVAVPDELAQARAREMWERTLRNLARQGVSRDAYLRVAGRTEDQVLAELLPSAAQALRREAVLTAIVEAEGMSPDDNELLGVLSASAERADVDASSRPADEDEPRPDSEPAPHGAQTAGDKGGKGDGERPESVDAAKLMEELRRGGRLEELREELAARKAIDLIVSEAKAIPLGRAQARAKLWTPEKELTQAEGEETSPPGAGAGSRGDAGESSGKRLWTPGS